MTEPKVTAPMIYKWRAFLCPVEGYHQAQTMAKQGVRDGTIPPGSLYVARFDAFYGPKPHKGSAQ